ncbi:hypothetical protein AX16_002691 [Volvariella volvacea WC 439]|nr:hypothetical protein AX16_002691 [Volvariella volvacea WC 439]
MNPTILGLAFICWFSIVIGNASAEQCRLRPQGEGRVGVGHGDNSSSSSSPHPTGTGASTTDTAGTTFPTPSPFEYGVDKIRGVNLGGWLVLEPWITPSIFEDTGNEDIVDEYTFGQLMDRDTAVSILRNHWETWITEDDFIAIKAAGLTHVRIPLGYWSVPLTADDTNISTSPSPYIPGAWPYLLRGLNWARQHGIRVIVDIHGAPGSQNGYDNSGQRRSDPQWALDSANIIRTVDTIRFIARNIGGMIDILQLLNEPAGFRGDNWLNAIRQYWLDGYDAVRQADESGMRVMIGDGFVGVGAWNNFLTPPRGEEVLMDLHRYQIFSDSELERSWDEHIAHSCSEIPSLTAYASSNIWTVIGEWSNAPTDCTRWLNGRGVGARWDGTYFPGPDSDFHGSCDGFSGSSERFTDEYKAFLRRYWEAQVEVGERIQGWVFWTWKAENSDEWSYQKGLEGGWIPQDPTDRLYPDICG